MNKEEILKASRKENKNKDLAEIEVMYQAGSHASIIRFLLQQTTSRFLHQTEMWACRKSAPCSEYRFRLPW